jgi:hypothetical protein
MAIVRRTRDKSKSLDAIRRSIEAGFTFGPNKRCAACNRKSDGSDAINRGVCNECWSEIENPQEVVKRIGGAVA